MKTSFNTKIPIILLGFFIFFSLLFPMCYVQLGTPYYTEFVIANFFIGLFIPWNFFQFKFNYNSKHKKIVLYLIILLVIYNLCALYVNFTHSRWLWEQFNVSLMVLLFICLLLYGDANLLLKKQYFSFLISCQTISTLLGIAVYFIGYSSVSLLNGTLTLIAHDPNHYEKRFNWFYFHKSQYCFILLLFIAFSVVYKKYFKTNTLFLISNAVYLWGIIISHTYTALFAAAFIYAGLVIDYIKPRLRQINQKFFLLLIPPALFLFLVFYVMSKERNIWTLGGRIYIWSESLHQITKNPLGIGNAFGWTSFSVPGLYFNVYNCHNTFLNEMYRFSLPVGLLFTIIFFSIIFYSLKINFSFLNIGIWSALLISLCMDYSLLGREFTITIFYIYIIFFLPYMSQHKV